LYPPERRFPKRKEGAQMLVADVPKLTALKRFFYWIRGAARFTHRHLATASTHAGQRAGR